MNFKKGFTLIEVVVVIGIIGILTVIIFPAINNIRAKNRDSERVADIASLQLGLSLYYNQHANEGYPNTLQSLLTGKYIPTDSIVDSEGKLYNYVPLTRDASATAKCTSYHLGAELELPSGQVDMADDFTSVTGIISNSYLHCGGYTGPGIAPGGKNYNVHP